MTQDLGLTTDRLRGVRILVLDDEEFISRMIRFTLAAQGGAVETAADGVTALQKLLEGDFDLVTVDLLMPRLNGLAFIQAARKIWPWLGFMIVTGVQQGDLLRKAKELGVARILHKPFQLESLVDMVRAEADDCVKRMAAMPAPSINRLQQHHRILRHIAATVVAAESFVDAMLEFQRGLAQIHPVDVQAVLGMEGNEPVFVVNRSKPVSGAAIDKLQGEAVTLFEALTGKPIPGTVARVLVDDPAHAPDSNAPAPQSAIMLPILTGDTLQGLLVLASMDEDLTQTMDISFFLSAANTLSSVMAGMNRMRHLANHDYLTGLCNRAYFDEALKHALSVSRRNERPLSILLMDLDAFKNINDAHGHRAGDQVLREFAHILSKEARESDLVVRYGGDEFAVLMLETGHEGALTRAHRIIASVASHVFLPDDHRLSLTASAGLAGSWNLDRSSPPSQILLYADLALYGAKQAGRNTVRVWEAPAHPDSAGVMPAGPRADERKGRILVVDDEKSIVGLVSRMLAANGYAVDSDTSAEAALSRIADNRAAYDIVMTDLTMPGTAGVELLQKLHAADSSLVKVVLSGYASKENAIACMRAGAADFLEKPVTEARLLAVVESAMGRRRLLLEAQRYRLQLEEFVHDRNTALMETTRQLEAAYSSTLRMIVSLLDARDPYTGQHSHRVKNMSEILGREMGLGKNDAEVLTVGALLHDIGKIGIPEAILRKAGPLSDTEWLVMKRHAEIGYQIVKDNPYIGQASEIVWAHHEKFDGTGYPRGLKGAEVHRVTRLFIVIDAYEAMRSDRAYRKALSRDEATRELLRCSGVHFDPDVVKAFINCQAEIDAAAEFKP